MVGSQGIYRHTSPLHQRIAGMGSERPDTELVEQNVRQQQRQDTIERRFARCVRPPPLLFGAPPKGPRAHFFARFSSFYFNKRRLLSSTV